jgi:hypothetical protein
MPAGLASNGANDAPIFALIVGVWITAKQRTMIGEKSTMSLSARLEALKERHAFLESRIFDEDNRPMPNTETVSRLKIEKLQVKDEMERIRASLH